MIFCAGELRMINKSKKLWWGCCYLFYFIIYSFFSHTYDLIIFLACFLCVCLWFCGFEYNAILAFLATCFDIIQNFCPKRKLDRDNMEHRSLWVSAIRSIPSTDRGIIVDVITAISKLNLSRENLCWIKSISKRKPHTKYH